MSKIEDGIEKTSEALEAFEKAGGSAFPAEWQLPFGGLLSSPGMTLRDWFAGHADITGYEFPDCDTAAKVMNINPPFDESFDEKVRFGFRLQAAMRFALADAMIAARSKDRSEP